MIAVLAISFISGILYSAYKYQQFLDGKSGGVKPMKTDSNYFFVFWGGDRGND